MVCNKWTLFVLFLILNSAMIYHYKMSSKVLTDNLETTAATNMPFSMVSQQVKYVL